MNTPYQKEQSQLSKLQKLLKPQEFAAAMVNITNKEQRLEILEKQFTELESHYKSVLEKLDQPVLSHIIEKTEMALQREKFEMWRYLCNEGF